MRSSQQSVSQTQQRSAFHFFGPAKEFTMLVVYTFFLIATLVVPASAQHTPEEDSPGSTPKAPSEMPVGGYFAPYPDAAHSSSEGLAMAESGVITAGSCKYRQVIDDPHMSGREISIHGSWKHVSGTCPDEANVDTYLQAYWCDRYQWYTICRWITVSSDSDDVRAGTGHGKRVTARRACTSSPDVGWRGYVDVDLIGIGDPKGYTYSRIIDFPCAPS